MFVLINEILNSKSVILIVTYQYYILQACWIRHKDLLEEADMVHYTECCLGKGDWRPWSAMRGHMNTWLGSEIKINEKHSVSYSKPSA